MGCVDQCHHRPPFWTRLWSQPFIDSLISIVAETLYWGVQWSGSPLQPTFPVSSSTPLHLTSHPISERWLWGWSGRVVMSPTPYSVIEASQRCRCRGRERWSHRLLTNRNSTVGTNTQYIWRQIHISTVSIPTFSVIPQCNILFFKIPSHFSLVGLSKSLCSNYTFSPAFVKHW